MDALPEQGSLEAWPAPVLLLALHRRRFSGRLDLSRDGVAKRVWLRDGVPVMAESNLPSESLGIQLLDAHRITHEDYARVVQTVRERGCREGVALLSLGLVGPRELFGALKDQVRRRLLDCFGWPLGEFSLDAEDPPSAEAAAFRCDPIGLAHEGVAVHWSPSRLREGLAGKAGRYPAPSRRFEALRARLHGGPEIDALLERLDGSASLARLLEAPPAPTALAALWVLDVAGAIEWRDAPLAAGAAEAEAAPLEFEIVCAAPDSSPARANPAAPAPSAPERAKPSPAVEALREQVQALHRELATLDHYGVLGLEADAGADAVRRAYLVSAKRFHPDALRRAGLADLVATAQEVFARIAEAHEVLADPARRREYDAERAGEGDGAARVVQAEALFRKGEVLLRAGNFAGAIEFLAPAAALWPEEAAYQSALGWALYKRGPSDPHTARTHLERAVALAPDDAVAHFRLGLVLRALGEGDAAQRALDAARRLDPKVR